MKRRITAEEYKLMASAYPAKKKIPKRQAESVDQKAYVKFLNSLNIGFFYRVKNMGTFDASRGFYRKNAELVSIPDLCFYLKGGKCGFIEVKRTKHVEGKKKLTFKVVSTDSQKQFLLDAHRAGCIVGFAFTQNDCLSIVMNDEKRYPRHPRTYAFLPKEEHEEYADRYRELIKAHAEAANDPVTRHVTWAAR